MANIHNTTLYIGRTENLPKRDYEHKNKLFEGFTKKYNLTKLVYYEVFDTKEAAAEREWKLKKWKRAWKEDLINNMNPQWQDLSTSL